MIIQPIKTSIFKEGDNLFNFIVHYFKKVPERSVIVVTSKIVALAEKRTAIELKQKYSVKYLGILITDSRTIPLRAGITGVALGYAGFRGIKDYRGRPDIFGRKFKVSRVNVADSLATVAVFVMGEGNEQQPLAIIKKAPVEFNEYDLNATLDAQFYRVKKDVEIKIKTLRPENKKEYIDGQLEKYKIQPLIFRQDDLTVTTREEMIRSEYFGSGFLVDPEKSYAKEVFSFHLPFSGDESLLHCVPSARITWTEEVTVEDKEIVFDIINFYNDAEKIKAEKDRILKYLIEQAEHINKQVNQYNSNLEQIIRNTIGQTKDKITQ